ncbi:winged helix-turn-helix transcriptional regulator [Erythrobacter sp. YJ-T3-07]|uniref:MarR family winged helix-turn-helix transcriptional regulator n=1 Tax=Erythrobacter sp. YJ-T3-07 TaxID=2793063 RepID=UPI0018D4CAF2|nr:MarR family winged helix-turn-helix transcriptional regulator [Erythrobacter sp. YJ-T3-07]MBH1945342.1 winged helix-turn-helix transcriptional regulator [Erythrobacter sp. YJ-T3-07]
MSDEATTPDDRTMLDEITSRCLAAPTLRTARVIGRSYDRALAGSGITITQFTLLVTIAKYRPTSIAQLGEWLDIEASTLSRNLAKLRKSGHVEPPGNEGRAQELVLTEKGIATLREVYPRWLKTQQDLEARLGPQNVAGVRSRLTDLRTA